MTRPTRAATCVAALLLTLVGCSTTSTSTTEEGPVTTKDGFSLLDDRGIEHIKQSRAARFDLRDRRLTREDVNIGRERLGPQVGKPGAPEIDLELVGPGGTEKASTSTFLAYFREPGGDATAITWFESYDTRAEGDAALADAVEHWGLPEDTVRNWQETVRFATDGPFADPEGTTRSSFGPGLAESGLVAEVTVRTIPEREGETLEVSVYLQPKYYTDDYLERLERQRR